MPRSVAWLRDRTLAHADGVTARDHALFETLLATTSAGIETEDTILAARLCPVEYALTVLSGGGSPAQPRELVASLARLFGRAPDPLKRDDSFSFHVPAWTVPLQQPGSRYAHLDLAVLALFRRRSSPLLYRDVLAHIAAEKLRYEPGRAPFALSYAPQELADVLGVAGAGPLHVGQLRLRHLDPAVEEIRKHVRSFEIVDVAIHHEARRRAGALVRGEDGKRLDGRAVTAIVLTIRLLPPERLETVRTRSLADDDFAFLKERMDAPGYAIRPETLVRLGSALPSTSLPRKKRGGAHPLLSSEMQSRYLYWLAGIDEALTGEAITPAFETAPLRGQRLLDAIAQDGADKAFWAFSMAEAEAPDLAPALYDKPRLRLAIEAARKARVDAARKDAAKERRQAVRQARADGAMPAPVPKRDNTDSHEKPVAPPAAPAPAAPSPPEPARPDPDAVVRALAILSTPEAKREAKDLSWYWQYALDFPLTQAGRLARLFLRTEFAAKFPLLHEADSLLGGPYVRNIRLLGRVFGVTKDNLAGDEKPIPHPCIDQDLADGVVLVMGKSFAFAVEGGRLGGIVERLGEDRNRMVAQANKALAEWKDRQKKLARAAARPRPEPPIPPIHCEVRMNALGVYERVDGA
ncbi:hypothetical protein [Methylobacterium ajmalii]|uniref:hypothetical protein n=1 Tax=Methylobacterium ajmalii TaxID=2738439 RepID=UPI00190DD86E|nr:hypothetical protein [Methylobacterium ajmalii]MBK3397138.1 hypothetical protein [Methylobacterium ajmalii]MBK3408353.1 hypothetical protein [Methylobacterium ajmalii]MBK3421169.1 hypothetical protein [Methylobacterium ajmalii]MBZ6411071.1 hypothetical protein [Methylobacterium sp.]